MDQLVIRLDRSLKQGKYFNRVVTGLVTSICIDMHHMCISIIKNILKIESIAWCKKGDHITTKYVIVEQLTNGGMTLRIK